MIRPWLVPMSFRPLFWLFLGVCLGVCLVCGERVSLVWGEEPARLAAPPPRRLLLAHYMPWYVAKPSSTVWGWHWTMNHFQPDQEQGGKRPIASHYYPLIGPYDSGDPHVLEYHLLTMKLAGVDGVIVDWYGRRDFRDYSVLHRNTERLLAATERFGMKFVICYEDQTIPAFESAGKLLGGSRVAHATEELKWLAANWFARGGYVRLEDRPVLLSFGQSGLTESEWTQCLADLGTPVAYFSQQHRRTGALGAFDWPLPKEGLAALDRFEKEARQWPHSIPAAFPRFVDIYAEAKVHDSWGRIEDDGGRTFKRSLERAWKSGSPLIQLVTWNDWGEGTVLEPSVEFGYRDLELIQAVRRFEAGAALEPTADDLRIPLRIYQRRASDNQQNSALDEVVLLCAQGRLVEARKRMEELRVGN